MSIVGDLINNPAQVEDMEQFNIFDILEERPADYVPASPDYSPIIPLPEQFPARRTDITRRIEHRETEGFVCPCWKCVQKEAMEYVVAVEKRASIVRNLVKVVAKYQRDPDMQVLYDNGYVIVNMLFCFDSELLDIYQVYDIECEDIFVLIRNIFNSIREAKKIIKAANVIKSYAKEFLYRPEGAMYKKAQFSYELNSLQMDCIGMQRQLEAEFKEEPVIKPEPVLPAIIIKNEKEREDDIIFIPDSPVQTIASVWRNINKRKTPDDCCAIRMIMKGVDYEFCDEPDPSNCTMKKYCKLCGNGKYYVSLEEADMQNGWYVCQSCQKGKRRKVAVNYAEL